MRGIGLDSSFYWPHTMRPIKAVQIDCRTQKTIAFELPSGYSRRKDIARYLWIEFDDALDILKKLQLLL